METPTASSTVPSTAMPMTTNPIPTPTTTATVSGSPTSDLTPVVVRPVIRGRTHRKPIAQLHVATFLIQVSPTDVGVSRTFVIRIQSAPYTHLVLTLQVVTIHAVTMGKGKHRHRIIHTVVLYQTAIRGKSDAYGRFTGHLRVVYPTSPSVTVGTPQPLQMPTPQATPAHTPTPTTAVNIYPNPVSFGADLVNTMGPLRVVTLVNTGTSILQLGHVVIGGVHSRDFAIVDENCTGAILYHNDQCTISVAFRPLVLGLLDAYIIVPNSPRNISVQGIGTLQEHDASH